MGITWTHLESVWNPSGPSEVPTLQTSNWSGTIFCRFLQQTGSSGIYFFRQIQSQKSSLEIFWQTVILLK